MHPQRGRALQIQRAIVNEAAFPSGDLRQLQSQTVDIFLGLAETDEAGTDKEAKDLAQPAFFNAVIIEFPRLVIDRGHEVLARVAELLCELDYLWKRLR